MLCQSSFFNWLKFLYCLVGVPSIVAGLGSDFLGWRVVSDHRPVLLLLGVRLHGRAFTRTRASCGIVRDVTTRWNRGLPATRRLTACSNDIAKLSVSVVFAETTTSQTKAVTRLLFRDNQASTQARPSPGRRAHAAQCHGSNVFCFIFSPPELNRYT